jgi:hypothetical protein
LIPIALQTAEAQPMTEENSISASRPSYVADTKAGGNEAANMPLGGY